MNERIPDARTERGPSRIRLGMVVDGLTVSEHICDFAAWALAHPRLELTHLIVLINRADGTAFSTPSGGKPRARPGRKILGYWGLAKLALGGVERLEGALLKREKAHFVYSHGRDLRTVVKNAAIVTWPQIAATPPRSDDSRIGAISALGLDLIVHFGISDPADELIEAARLGILAIRYNEDGLHSAAPPGFWEVLQQHETTGFSIVHLQEYGRCPVLANGNQPTRHYYLLNQAVAFRRAHHQLKSVVERIAANGRLPEPRPGLPCSQRVFGPPGLNDIALYAARRCRSMLSKRVRRSLGIQYRSKVAYVPRDWRGAVLAEGIELPNRPFHYLADPFVIRRDGRVFCFVEDFDYAKQRGCIDVHELANGTSRRLGTAIAEPFHLSFPFPFEYGGELYMCPESSENRDIRLYKCIEFPLHWSLETIAMEGPSAVDTMLFEKAGKWWMLTNIDPLGIGELCSELWIFSADSPLAGGWRPHPLNPVINDAARARNAGLIVSEGQHFRMSQGQAFDFYGKRVFINQITELSDTGYGETCLSVMTPSFRRGTVGTHHLHSDGATTVYDFVASSRIGRAE